MTNVYPNHTVRHSITKEQTMKRIQSLAFALAFTVPLTTYAAGPADMNSGGMSQGGSGQSGMGGMDKGKAGAMAPSNMQNTGTMPGMAAGMAQGEIRKVDKSARKLTIKHGPLQNLDMPAMTMVYKVKDPAMLDQVKAGDKINFVAENVNGVLTVNDIETTK